MLSDPAHPLWKLLRLIVLCVVSLVTFQMCYKSGLVLKDALPILTMLLSVAGFDQAKAAITASKE